MGNDHPIKTTCWIKFLEYKKCKHQRTRASHDQYKCPGCFRTITFRAKDKDIPGLHIRTSLKSMQIPYQEFLEWKKLNC